MCSVHDCFYWIHTNKYDNWLTRQLKPFLKMPTFASPPGIIYMLTDSVAERIRVVTFEKVKLRDQEGVGSNPSPATSRWSFQHWHNIWSLLCSVPTLLCFVSVLKWVNSILFFLFVYFFFRVMQEDSHWAMHHPCSSMLLFCCVILVCI